LDEEKDPKGYPSGQVGTKALEKGMPPKSGKSKVLPGDPSAPSPGELLASKNTELGFKQRKVNKRLKSYEEVEEKDGGDPGGPDDVKGRLISFASLVTELIMFFFDIRQEKLLRIIISVVLTDFAHLVSL
jgi:hypothetical protein